MASLPANFRIILGPPVEVVGQLSCKISIASITWMFWHEFRNIVRLAVYYNPAVILVVMFCNLLATELTPLRLFLATVIHLQLRDAGYRSVSGTFLVNDSATGVEL